MPELLQFRAVDTHYGDLHVLKGVDYRIDEGEIVCLLGGNASGKSTTMKAIMGIVVPTRGDILFDGKSLNGWQIFKARKNNTWEVKDGTLHCKPLNESVKGDGDER